MTAALAAKTLTHAIRTGDQLTVQRILTRPDLPRIAVELALQIPAPSRRRLVAPSRRMPESEMKPHGTHAAFNRHKAHGEEPCSTCWEGERIYQAQRARDRRRNPPMEYLPAAIDDVAIAAFTAGENVPLTDQEKPIAARILAGRGVPPTPIAERLHVAPRKVLRWIDSASTPVHSCQTNREGLAS